MLIPMVIGMIQHLPQSIEEVKNLPEGEDTE